MILWWLACAPQLSPGQLPECPSSPNCISSRGDEDHHVEPLPAVPMDELVMAVRALPGCVVQQRTSDWLAAACTTPSGLFTDDLVLSIEAGAVHVTSASRVGYGDLGVNRERVDALWRRLLDRQPSP